MSQMDSTAVAALCEPALLRQPAHARGVLETLDKLAGRVHAASTRRHLPGNPSEGR